MKQETIEKALCLLFVALAGFIGHKVELYYGREAGAVAVLVAFVAMCAPTFWVTGKIYNND